MARNRAAGLGDLLRSFSLAKSPAQMALGFASFCTFYLLNLLFFPEYNILRKATGFLRDAWSDLIGGFQVGDAAENVGRALEATIHVDDAGKWSVVLFYLLVWTIVTFLWGAMSRIAAVQAGQGRGIGLRGGFGYLMAGGRWRAYFLPPIFFGTGFLCLVLAMSVVGIFGHIWLLFGAALYVVAFVLALGAVVVVVTGLVSFPFLAPAISADGANSFGAISRSCMYIFSRLPKYLLFIIVAGLLGLVAIMVVSTLLGTAVNLSFDMLDFWWDLLGEEDAPLEFANVYNTVIIEYDLEGTSVFEYNAEAERSEFGFLVGLIGLVVWMIMALVPAYGISYACSASTLTYLVFRRDEDGTPFDEIYAEEDLFEEELLDDVINAHLPDALEATEPSGEAKRVTIQRPGQDGGDS